MHRLFFLAAVAAAGLTAKSAFADCASQCRHAIDPEACERGCEEGNPTPPWDPGAYCRELLQSDPNEWWIECGDGTEPQPAEPTGGDSGCPHAPHCI